MAGHPRIRTSVSADGLRRRELRGVAELRVADRTLGDLLDLRIVKHRVERALERRDILALGCDEELKILGRVV
jgi:hypothetical protein